MGIVCGGGKSRWPFAYSPNCRSDNSVCCSVLQCVLRCDVREEETSSDIYQNSTVVTLRGRESAREGARKGERL